MNTNRALNQWWNVLTSNQHVCIESRDYQFLASNLTCFFRARNLPKKNLAASRYDRRASFLYKLTCTSFLYKFLARLSPHKGSWRYGGEKLALGNSMSNAISLPGLWFMAPVDWLHRDWPQCLCWIWNCVYYYLFAQLTFFCYSLSAKLTCHTDALLGSPVEFKVIDVNKVVVRGDGLGLVPTNRVASFVITAQDAQLSDIDVAITSTS